MRFKRLFSLLIAACLAVCMIPAKAWADESGDKDILQDDRISETLSEGDADEGTSKDKADSELNEKEYEEPTKYALCVGINDYIDKYINDLTGCVNDATYMYNNLKERGGWKEENMTLLTDKYATKEEIRKAIRGYADKASGAKGDIFILQWSSHGLNASDNYGNYTVVTALCTADTLSDSYCNDYFDYELAEDLMCFESGVKVIIIVDACHSGGLFKTHSDDSDDNDKGIDASEESSFDLAERVSNIMDEKLSDEEYGPKVSNALKSNEIGWVTAADYYQSSLDGGFYDCDEWMPIFSYDKEKPSDTDKPGGVFLASLTWGWWNAEADAAFKGDGDGYLDAYEGWAYGSYYANIWYFKPCCKNIDVLRSVELGWVGNSAPSEDVIFDSISAQNVDIGEEAAVTVAAHDADNSDGAIELSVNAETEGITEEDYSFEGGILKFTPETDGIYRFTVTARNEATGVNATKLVCITAKLPAPKMLQPTEVSFDSFYAKWAGVDNVLGYELQVSDSRIFDPFDGTDDYELPLKKDFIEIDENNNCSFYIDYYDVYDGLYPNKKYYYRVRAINNMYSDWSDPIMVTTDNYPKTVLTKEPEAKAGLVYSGEWQELINEGTVEDGELIYAVVPSEVDPKGDYSELYDLWNTEVPEEVDAGTYWIYYYYGSYYSISNNDTKKTELAGFYESDVFCLKTTIAPKKVTSPTIELSQEFCIYDGKAKTPEVIVMDGDAIIPSDEYEVTYTNNTAVGTATVKITDVPGGNYVVSGSKTFTIGGVKADWFWNDNGSAVAYFTSSGSNSYNASVKATVTNKITKPATVTTPGVKTYTGTVTYNGKVYTSTHDEPVYVFDKSATGLKKYNNVLYYVKNGVQDTGFNGLAKYGSDWYYVAGGKVDTAKKDVLKGTVNGTNAWWFVSGGKVQFVDSIEKNSNGWWKITNGKVDFNFNGIAKNENGWWYCKGGKVDFNKKDVIKGTVNGESGWWFVSGGKVQFVDSVEKNSNGWWVIRNGKVDFNYTGFAKNGYGWWYCKGGKVDFNKKDVLKGTVNGTNAWWYVSGGKVQFVDSVEKNSNGWWKITNGKVDFNYNGLAKNSYGWWYLKGGKVDFNFTGIAKNQYGEWYCKGGKVQFDYTGIVRIAGMSISIKGGKVVK